MTPTHYPAMAPLLAGLAALLMTACGGGDSSPPSAVQIDYAAQCAQLNGKTYRGVTVTSATRVAPVAANAASAAAALPGYCQVLATRAPFLDIEVDLPDNWTQRLFHQGGSGFDGRIPSVKSAGLISPALADKGAVYAASNGGNRAAVPAEAAPAVWASGTANGAASATDYAYLAVGTTIRFAKDVTVAFFGQPPKYTYFSGCSNGGRNAYIAAQRWPEEYDGIVAGCETMDMAGQTTAWMNMASRSGTPKMPSAAKWAAVYQQAVKACDANDGLEDGVIANPASCNYDPAAWQCGAAGADPATCLSASELQTVKDQLSDIKLSNGSVVYSRYPWANWGGSGPTAYGGLGGGFALLATNNPAWLSPAQQATFDLNRDSQIFASGMQSLGADHDKSAIAAYVASGKKLISWHGSADELLSPYDHVRNYNTMTTLAGTTANSRFFTVTGVAHSSRLHQTDWFGAIADWVEKGIAPEQLVNSPLDATGKVLRTLPVCQYPKYPKYNGSGDKAVASSFTCTAPVGP